MVLTYIVHETTLCAKKKFLVNLTRQCVLAVFFAASSVLSEVMYSLL
jgi:hypothetical protein